MSVLYYSYNPETLEYIGPPHECKISPRDGEIVYPAFSTLSIPPSVKKGEVVIFNNGKWDIVEDHRSELIYNKLTGELAIMTGIGKIPKEYTTQKPPEDSKWEDGKWVVDEKKSNLNKYNELTSRIDKLNLSSIPFLRKFIIEEDKKYLEDLNKIEKEIKSLEDERDKLNIREAS